MRYEFMKRCLPVADASQEMSASALEPGNSGPARLAMHPFTCSAIYPPAFLIPLFLPLCNACEELPRCRPGVRHREVFLCAGSGSEHSINSYSDDFVIWRTWNDMTGAMLWL